MLIQILVFKSIDGLGQLLNIYLKILGDRVKEVANKFESITFFHVFMEKYMKDKKLSMEHNQVEKGKAIIKENMDRIIYVSKVFYGQSK